MSRLFQFYVADGKPPVSFISAPAMSRFAVQHCQLRVTTGAYDGATVRPRRRRFCLTGGDTHLYSNHKGAGDAPAIAVNRARCRSWSLLQNPIRFLTTGSMIEIAMIRTPVLKAPVAI